jgi:hypothetical protein
MKATGWAAALFLLLGLASTFNLGSAKPSPVTKKKAKK